jgi:tripeptidyl-peptidase-1
VFVGGSVEPVAGTSCSAPIIAGIVSLWNGLRLQSGKQSMGFINPFLYKSASYSSAYYDVTSGNNADGTFFSLLSHNRAHFPPFTQCV